MKFVGIITVLLAVIISAQGNADGRVQGRSTSFLEEVVKMMQSTRDAGTCPSPCCVQVEVEDGKTEQRIIDIDQSVAASQKDPCVIYICKENGLSKENVVCTNEHLECGEGLVRVKYPGECCSRCGKGPKNPKCALTDWSNWGECFGTCGNGQQVRVRRVANLRLTTDSINCKERLSECRPCNAPCPRDCKWKTERVGECSEPPICKGEVVKEFYNITQQPSDGGRPCPPWVRRNETNVTKCCQDCEWRNETDKKCPQPPNCKGGSERQFHIITKPQIGQGKDCPAYVIKNETYIPCCENCVKKWKCGKCIADNGRDCGPGKKQCTEIIVKEAIAGGECPPVQTRNESCELPRCKTCKDDEHECFIKELGVTVCVKNSSKIDCNNCFLRTINRIDDTDLDYIHNDCDNCKTVFNPSQLDSDNDGIGDSCPCKGEDEDFNGFPDNCNRGLVAQQEVEQEEVHDKKSAVVAIMDKLLKMYYNSK